MIRLEVLSPEQWASFYRNEHMISFGEERDPSEDRISFAMIAHDGEAPNCYMTVIELSKTSVYLQHGGGLPGIDPGGLNTKIARGYYIMIEYLRARYKSASTKVSAKNRAMIKLHKSAGFQATGTDMFQAPPGSYFYILTKDFTLDVEPREI